MPYQPLDANNLRQITDDMIVALTSPAFVDAMRILKLTPADQRLNIGSKILTSEALRAKGVPLPHGVRVTSRYFETGAPTIEVTDPAEAGYPPITNLLPDFANPMTGLIGGVRPMAGGCCCGGAASACGGCGGAQIF
jgi:hypothetical protein